MQRINEDIKTGNFKQIYLLYGEERYLKNQYTTRLRKALCQEGDEMNTHFYQGKDFSVGEVIDLAETLPFLAERRVMFFKATGLFKSGGEKLAEYLASPNNTTFFVFTESEVDKRSKLYKAVQSKGYAAEFTVQDENSLKRWIAGILGREGKKISENTAQLLLSKTGTDMENIQMELEKLICYCLDRDVVTAEDVEAVCTTRITNHIFDMVNAIAEKHGIEIQSLQAFIQEIIDRMIFDGEKLSDLLAPLDLSWRERTQKELDLMDDLIPLLKKLADGREIVGLNAYE